jgi:hypothetical protein
MISLIKVLFPIIVMLMSLQAKSDLESILKQSFDALNSAKSDFRGSRSPSTADSVLDLSGTKSIFATDFTPIEFNFDITPPSYSHKTSKIKNPNNPTGPSLDLIINAPSETTPYLAYKCNRAKEQMLQSASNPAISVDLSAAIDQLLDGVTKMETDLKSSIASSISGYFSSVQSYFRPEYVMSKALEVMTNTYSEVSCTTCAETLIGCDDVFFIANAYKEKAEKSINDSYEATKIQTKTSVKESGSVVDVGILGCPTVSLLTMPTGFASIIKNKTSEQAQEYVSAHIESVNKELDADAMKICISSKKEQIMGFFKDVLDTAAGSIEVEVEAQNKCLDENSNSLSQSYKNDEILNETIRDYFVSYNMFIAGDDKDDDINGISGTVQKFTGGILDKVYNKIDILNTGVIPNKKTATLEPSKIALDTIMEPHIGAHPNSSVQSILEYSIDLISRQISSSASKQLAYSMAKQIANNLHLKHKFMIEFTNDYKLITATDVDASFDFITAKNKLLSVISDYEDILVQEISFNPTRPAPYFACSQFDTTNTPNPNSLTEDKLTNICFLERKIQRFSDVKSYTATCSCTDFGKLIDIISNPISKRGYLAGMLPDQFDLPADTSMVPWKRQFSHLLIDTKLAYLKELTEGLIRIQSDIDKYLVNMSLVEQAEVKRLFRMTIKNFKL